MVELSPLSNGRARNCGDRIGVDSPTKRLGVARVDAGCAGCLLDLPGPQRLNEIPLPRSPKARDRGHPRVNESPLPRSPKARDRGHPRLSGIRLEIRAARLPPPPPRSPKARDRGHPRLNGIRLEIKATRLPPPPPRSPKARDRGHPRVNGIRVEIKATRRSSLEKNAGPSTPRAARSAARFAQDDIRFLSLRMTFDFCRSG